MRIITYPSTTKQVKSFVCKYKKTTFFGLIGFCIFAYYTGTILRFTREFVIQNNFDPKLRRTYHPTAIPQIPKIIHQMFFNISDNRDEFWRKYRPYQQTWFDMNPDHKYILWSAAMVDKLMDDHYPELKPIYRKYENTSWVSRADMARYMVMHHMGGVYADLDVKCLQNLNAVYRHAENKALLLNFTWNPIGVSNDFFAASQHHNFFRFVLDGLYEADVTYLSPYMGVMFRTGPVYILGRSINYPFQDEIYWLPPEVTLNVTDRTNFGQSWHLFDGRTIDLLWTRTGPKKILLFLFPFVCVYVWFTRFYLSRKKDKDDLHIL